MKEGIAVARMGKKKKGCGCYFWMIRTGYNIMISARSVCMNVSRASGAGLCGVGSITLSGEKGSVWFIWYFWKGLR